MTGTDSMRLERVEVERERDIWAVAVLPPGAQFRSGGRFFIGVHTNDRSHGELKRRGFWGAVVTLGQGEDGGGGGRG